MADNTVTVDRLLACSVEAFNYQSNSVRGFLLSVLFWDWDSEQCLFSLPESRGGWDYKCRRSRLVQTLLERMESVANKIWGS